MKSSIIAVVVFLTLCISSYAADERSVQKSLTQDNIYIMDAILFVKDLVQVSVPLKSVPDVPEVSELCRFSNDDIESYIREFTRQHEGGTSRKAVGRALYNLRATLESIVDLNHDNVLSSAELSFLEKLKLECGGVLILMYLSDAYKDVPL